MNNKKYTRDTKYWNKYYKNNCAPSEKSAFAEFVSAYIEKNKTLVDCGCGNGRDSVYFSKLGTVVTCVDASNESIDSLKSREDNKAMELICADFVTSDLIWNKKYDYVYSRFSLHAISKHQQDIFLKNAKASLQDNGLLFIEVRSVNDELYGKGEKIGNDEYYYENHYRRFLRIEELVCDLESLGLSVEYAEEKRDFAKYNDQNPPIIRIVARKKN